MSRDTSGNTPSDVVDWTGDTPDSVLALGATEYPVSEARAIVALFAKVTTSLDINAFVEGFTDDCVVAFNERSGIIGRQGVHDLMGPRFEHLAAPGSDFICRKALRSLTGNVFGVVWLNDWIDTKAQQRMRSKGVEFWVMQKSRIARWDCCVSAWAA